MSRLQSCLQNLKVKNQKAVVPYIVAGDPGPSATVPAMHAMVNAGADIIELGVPFSDPMAEGPVIQLGHERALSHQVGLRDVLAMVSEFRADDADTPVVLMGYANPVEVMGYTAFAAMAEQVGVDGVLTVDMPPEEAGPLNEALSAVSIDAIFLIAPTTSESRAREICASASGYIYYVSLKGVTGAGHLDTDDVNRKVTAIKAMTELPICVGFGIKDADTAAALSGLADGVVVGSVLVDAMGGGAKPEQPAKIPSAEQIGKINAALAKIVKDISAGANR